MSSRNKSPEFRAITSVWMLLQLSTMVIIIPMLVAFPENGMWFLIIQVSGSMAILTAQRISHQRQLTQCRICRKERIFHNIKKYPEFESIVCKKFTTRLDNNWHV